VHGGIGIGEPLVVGGQEIVALGRGNDLGERSPGFRIERAQAVEEPVDLAPAAEEDAAQDESRAAPGMRLAVREREQDPPNTSQRSMPR
jgi:hypothetical protein